MKDVFFEQALQLIEKRDYRAALDVLFSIWKSTADEELAEQILIAFRKSKQWGQHKKWLSIFLERFPNASFLESEKKKSSYEKGISDVVRSADLSTMDGNAEKIFAEGNLKGQALVKLVFPIIRKAKSEGKWELAEKWIDRVDEACLDADESKDQSISQLKHYYLHKEDIYKATKRYDLLISVLEESLAHFPKTLATKKSLIAAYIESGNLEQARSYIESKLDWKRPNWYFVEQLAHVESEAGNDELAWKYACIAFNTRGSQKHKLELHLLIAKIAEKLGKNDLSNDFKTLSILVRSEEKLPLNDELLEHIKNISDASLTVPKILQKYREDIIDGINQNREKCSGEIVWFPLDRNFARVKYDEHKSTIIFKSDLDEDCHYQGAKVNFYLEETTDPKSGKKSKIGKFGTKQFKL